MSGARILGSVGILAVSLSTLESCAGPRRQTNAAGPTTCISAEACLRDGVGATLAGDPRAAEAPLLRACELDLPDACLILGLLWANRTEAPWRTRGAALLEQAAATGDPEAQAVLAATQSARPGPSRVAALATLEILCDDSPPIGCRARAVALAGESPARLRSGQVLLEFACLGHDADACVLLGDWQYQGRAELAQASRAVAAWLAGCWAGAVEGCTRAGAALSEGVGAPADDRHASSLFEHACAEGHEEACAHALTAAVAADRTDDIPEELPGRVASACERGSALACEAMAELILNDPDAPPSLAEALAAVHHACELGSGIACARVALLRQAHLAEGDPAAALRQACGHGESWACDDTDEAIAGLGENVGPEEDESPAGPWLRIWRQTRDAQTRSALTVLPPPAVVWPPAYHQNACLLGRTSSCARQSPADALGAAEQLCEQDRLAACLFAAAQQTNGEGATPASHPAASFWQRGCALGHGPSCWNLARLWLDTGEPQHRTVGIDWLQKACAAGFADACEELAARGLAP